MYKYIAAAAIAAAGLVFAASSANAGAKGQCTFYEHYNYGGFSRSVPDIDPMARLGYYNNKISSVKCDPHCAMAGYDFAYFKGDVTKGQVKGFDGWNPRITDFNDRISSLRVRCAP